MGPVLLSVSLLLPDDVSDRVWLLLLAPGAVLKGAARVMGGLDLSAAAFLAAVVCVRPVPPDVAASSRARDLVTGAAGAGASRSDSAVRVRDRVLVVGPVGTVVAVPGRFLAALAALGPYASALTSLMLPGDVADGAVDGRDGSLSETEASSSSCRTGRMDFFVCCGLSACGGTGGPTSTARRSLV